MQPARRELGGGGAQFVAEDEVGAQLGVVGGALGGQIGLTVSPNSQPRRYRQNAPPRSRASAPSRRRRRVASAKVVIERPTARAVVAALRARARLDGDAVRLEAVLAHEPLQLDARALVRSAAERRREPPEHVDRAAAALDKGVVRRERQRGARGARR